MTTLEIAAALTDTVGRIPHIEGLYMAALTPNKPSSQTHCSEPVALYLVYVVPDMQAVYGEEGSEKEQEAVRIETEQESKFVATTGCDLQVIDVVADINDVWKQMSLAERRGLIFEKVPLYTEVV